MSKFLPTVLYFPFFPSRGQAFVDVPAEVKTPPPPSLLDADTVWFDQPRLPYFQQLANDRHFYSHAPQPSNKVKKKKNFISPISEYQRQLVFQIIHDLADTCKII